MLPKPPDRGTSQAEASTRPIGRSLDEDSPVAQLEYLLSRLGRRLSAILWRYGVPPRDAEDLLQETLLLFLQKRSTIRRPEAWIVTTLRNQALMYLRRRISRRRVVLEPGHDLRPAALVTETRGQDRLEARLTLASAMRRVRGKQREALRLRYIEGLSAEEVARRLGYRPASIRKILGRARGSLRKAVDRRLAT